MIYIPEQDYALFVEPLQSSAILGRRVRDRGIDILTSLQSRWQFDTQSRAHDFMLLSYFELFQSSSSVWPRDVPDTHLRRFALDFSIDDG